MTLSHDPRSTEPWKQEMDFSPREQRPQEALSSGGSEVWVCWEYRPEDWARYEQIDWYQIRLRFWVLTILSTLFLFQTVLPWFLLDLNAAPDQQIMAVLFPSGLILFNVFSFFWGWTFLAYPGARERHQARRKEPHTVMFAKTGVWVAGTFFPLADTSHRLLLVTLTSKSSVLHFRFERVFTGGYSSKWLKVFVPRGQEREVAWLVERYQTEVITEQK